MNKAITLVALALIVGGFLLVTFSYASPTSPTGTNGLPDISDITHGTGRPDPPNDYVPDTQISDDTTPPADETIPPTDETTPPANDTTPPPASETYRIKYFTQGQTVNGGSTTNPGTVTVTMNYPVNHYHKEVALIRLNSGTNVRWDLYKNGALKADAPDPTVGVTRTIYLHESSSISSNMYVLKVYGSGVVQATFYCEQWPSSQMNIFGSQTNDMTIGVLVIIVGVVLLFLMGRK